MFLHVELMLARNIYVCINFFVLLSSFQFGISIFSTILYENSWNIFIRTEGWMWWNHIKFNMNTNEFFGGHLLYSGPVNGLCVWIEMVLTRFFSLLLLFVFHNFVIADWIRIKSTWKSLYFDFLGIFAQPCKNIYINIICGLFMPNTHMNHTQALKYVLILLIQTHTHAAQLKYIKSIDVFELHDICNFSSIELIRFRKLFMVFVLRFEIKWQINFDKFSKQKRFFARTLVKWE